MKNYRQLIKELPSKTLVMSVGSFNPPTLQSEMAFKLVEKLVETHNADHVIYVTEEANTLPVDRKIHFLELMFNKFNFRPLHEDRMVAELGKLKSKYKSVIVVTSEDKSKLYESMQVVSTGYPDIEASKLKSMVTKGDYTTFKKNLPSSVRDIDAKRMMNEMRHAQGLEFIKEDVKFSVDALRDKYFKGEIYHIGDIVESAGQQYEIMDRGSNYLVVVNNTGDLSRKWVKDVTLVEAKSDLSKACWNGYKAVGLKKKNGRTVPNCVPESVLNPADPHGDYAEKSKTLQTLSGNKDVDQKVVQQRRLDLDKEYSKHKLKEENDPQVSYKGYTTKNMHHCCDLAKTFKLAAADAKDPVAMLNAIKTTDTYLELHGQTGDNPPLDKIKTWKYAHIKAKEALQKIGHFEAHKEQWMQSSDTLDKMLAPHADKLREAIEIGKHSNQNVERSAMTYQQYMKMGKKEPGFVKDTKYGPFTTAIDPNVSQQIDDLEPQWPRHVPTKVGHTYATRDHLRRQKVMYAHHESVQHGDLMDEDFATKFVAEGSGEVGDEIGNDKVVKVKTLPPELAPKKEVGDVEKEKGKGFSALFNGKENVDFDFQTFKNYRLQRENGKKNK